MPRKPTENDYVTFSVRMPKPLRARLEAIARERDLEVSQLIRHACDALVRYYDLHEGNLHLPITFTQLWKCLDVEAIAKLRKAANPQDVALLNEQESSYAAKPPAT